MPHYWPLSGASVIADITIDKHLAVILYKNASFSNHGNNHFYIDFKYRKSIKEDILPYSNWVEEDIFRKVDGQELIKYRIVISTLIHAGKYMRKYHPDVVFVDEAAQACEPEADCALAMLSAHNKNRQIVLTGDPHQLGPSLSSLVSAKYGLGISLLERLMKLKLYESRNPNFITKLLQNFRSHSMILKLPNELFYGGELQVNTIL